MKKNLALAVAGGDAGRGARPGCPPAEVTEMEKRLAARDLSFDPAPDADDEEDSLFARRSICRRRDADPASAGRRRGVGRHHATTRLRRAWRRWMRAAARHPGNAAGWRETRRRCTSSPTSYGVSAERIRQIEANAIKKLKKLVVLEAA